MNLTHLDEQDRPKMVDVGQKDDTTRVAVASGVIIMSDDAYDTIVSNTNKKGPVLQTAVIAAVNVVLPWSTWPIVPILTCGLVLSNFSFAILDFLRRI